MTIKNDKLDEKFESSFDVDAEVADPVAKGSNARPADKTDGEKASKSLTKAQMISGMTHASYKLSHPELTDKYKEFFALAGKDVSAEHNKATIKAGGLKEDVDAVFEGSDLSEEAKEKVTTIFEAAVNSAIVAETARLEEEFEEKLEEQVASVMDTLQEALEKYLDHAANQWLEENKLQVESGLRADIAESFLTGMKSLFVEHYVEVPVEAVDVVEALSSEVESLKAALNESENAVIAAKAELAEQADAAQKAADAVAATEVLATVSEGLTDSQREKLATLAESVDFTDAATYKSKLTAISESLIQKKPAASASEQLNEEVDLVEDGKAASKVIDPQVAAAMAVGNRMRR